MVRCRPARRGCRLCRLPGARAVADRSGCQQDHRARHQRQPGDDLERLREQPVRRPRDRHRRLHQRNPVARVADEAVGLRDCARGGRRGAGRVQPGPMVRQDAHADSEGAAVRHTELHRRHQGRAARRGVRHEGRPVFDRGARIRRPAHREGYRRKEGDGGPGGARGDQREQGGDQGHLGADSRESDLRIRARRAPRHQARTTDLPNTSTRSRSRP